MSSSVNKTSNFSSTHRTTHQVFMKTCEFCQFPKSKNPANRAIAGLIRFDSFGVIPLGFEPRTTTLKV
jgi:hypothetical protein